MTKTRWIFIALILIVAVIVGAALLARYLGSEPVVTQTGAIEVRVICALPVEPFVQQAARQYNAEKHTLEGRVIKVTVVPMDGLTAIREIRKAEKESGRQRAPVVVLSANVSADDRAASMAAGADDHIGKPIQTDTLVAAIMGALGHLRDEKGLAVLRVEQNVRAAFKIADRVMVMYGGKVVEEATVDALFHNPTHPYTIGLLNSRPSLTTDRSSLKPIEGSPPDPSNLPPGCVFAPRCQYAFELGRSIQPTLQPCTNGGLRACHRAVSELEYQA